MNSFEALKGRRSIRSFKEDNVACEIIERLLDAARWAPSGGNKQPWRFVVVKDAIKRMMIKAVSPGLAGDPPVIIVACMVRGDSPEEVESTKLLDLGAAIENLLLAAHSLGLGACWIVSTNWRGVKETIELPEDSCIVPVSLITLGYSDEITPRKRSRAPISEIAFKDKIGESWVTKSGE
jgi:nitroreductase